MNDRLGNKIRLLHMFEAIIEIENYIQDIDFVIFSDSSLIFHASLMQLEIIGEAASKISEDLILKNTNIPWRNIKGLRNIIAHEYFGVDKNTIWDIITNELPDLKKNINTIIQNIN